MPGLIKITVLRIQLILLRIRILGPHWKKMDPDPNLGYFFKINWIFIRILSTEKTYKGLYKHVALVPVFPFLAFYVVNPT